MQDKLFMKLCQLAKLKPDDSERVRLEADLENMIVMLDLIQKAPVDLVVPMSHLAHLGGENLMLRKDEVTSMDGASMDAGSSAEQNDSLQSIAPKTNAGYYLVPRVIDS